MNIVTTSGPMFDGRAALAVKQYVPAVAEDVGKVAVSRVHSGTGIFRHPTGAYESRITLDGQGNSVTIHDQNSVYGPWLEGTGSRNKSTRFKGYHFWRKALQETEARAGAVAERTLQPYLHRMQ